MVLAVYALPRPFRRAIRPAATPAIHSSPMLSNVRPADACSRRCAPAFLPAPSHASTSLRSFVTGCCPFRFPSDRVAASTPPRPGAAAPGVVAFLSRTPSPVRHEDARRFRPAPVRHDGLRWARGKLVPGGHTGAHLSGPRAFVGVRWGWPAPKRIRASWLCSADLAVHRDAGGGTRTPDTRIMIPLHFGSAARFEGAGGHERGHVCWHNGGSPRGSGWRGAGARTARPGFRPPDRRAPVQPAGQAASASGASVAGARARVAVRGYDDVRAESQYREPAVLRPEDPRCCSATPRRRSSPSPMSSTRSGCRRRAIRWAPLRLRLRATRSRR